MPVRSRRDAKLEHRDANIETSEDERSIANKLENETKRDKEEDLKSFEEKLLQEDPTAPVRDRWLRVGSKASLTDTRTGQTARQRAIKGSQDRQGAYG